MPPDPSPEATVLAFTAAVPEREPAAVPIPGAVEATVVLENGVPSQAEQAPIVVKVPPIARPAERVRLFNRELSWIEFNRRVLAQAEDPNVPVLERLKFLAICANNLDEFFMVRLGGIRELIKAGISEPAPDGLVPIDELKAIRQRVQALLTEIYRCLNDGVLPALKKSGIRIQKFSNFSRKEQEALNTIYRQQVSPILTPLALDPGHPFPFLTNLALNIAIILTSEKGEEHTAFLKVPPLAPRLIALPQSNRYIPIEALIAEHAEEFFPGLKAQRVVPFRVIRNADILLREDEVQDLLQSVESELRRRERKEVVWIEIGPESDESLMSLLTRATHVSR